MPPRQPFPVRWLMTDERLGDPVALLRRVPRGTGVVFRHHATPRAERRNMLLKVARISGRRLTLLRGGAGGIGNASLPVHGRRPRTLSAPVHSRAEAVAAYRAGARVLFVSPVFATRSHSDARPLGPRRAAAILRGLKVWRIALGGMTPEKYRGIQALGFDGWAAIDWWTTALPSPSSHQP